MVNYRDHFRERQRDFLIIDGQAGQFQRKKSKIRIGHEAFIGSKASVVTEALPRLDLSSGNSDRCRKVSLGDETGVAKRVHN